MEALPLTQEVLKRDTQAIERRKAIEKEAKKKVAIDDQLAYMIVKKTVGRNGVTSESVFWEPKDAAFCFQQGYAWTYTHDGSLCRKKQPMWCDP